MWLQPGWLLPHCGVPLTTIAPLGCSTTLRPLLATPPMSVATCPVPLVPNGRSRLPLALKRATTMSLAKVPFDSSISKSPASTILPSGWIATARARPLTLPLTLPPVPKPVSRVPSLL